MVTIIPLVLIMNVSFLTAGHFLVLNRLLLYYYLESFLEQTHLHICGWFHSDGDRRGIYIHKIPRCWCSYLRRTDLALPGTRPHLREGRERPRKWWKETKADKKKSCSNYWHQQSIGLWDAGADVCNTPKTSKKYAVYIESVNYGSKHILEHISDTYSVAKHCFSFS